jgi:hypothetical protein
MTLHVAKLFRIYARSIEELSYHDFYKGKDVPVLYFEYEAMKAYWGV